MKVFERENDFFGGETYPVDVVEDVGSGRLGRQESRRKHEKNRAQKQLHLEAEGRAEGQKRDGESAEKRESDEGGQNDVKEGEIA